MLHHAENVEKRAALEIPFIVWIDLVIQARAVVVPQCLLEKIRAVSHKMFACRAENVIKEIAEAAEISTVVESSIRVEAGRDVPVHGIELYLAGASFRENLVGRPGLMRAVTELGLAGDGLGIHLPVLIDLDLRIDPANAIKTHRTTRRRAEAIRDGVQFAVGVDHSDAVVLSQLTIDAQNSEVSVLPGERVGVNHASARRAIIGHQRPNVPWAGFAGQPPSIQRIIDLPLEAQIQRVFDEISMF